jgi:hypothetical protein
MKMVILPLVSSRLLRVKVITNSSVVEAGDEQSPSIAAEKESVFLSLSPYCLDRTGNPHLIISLLASFL